MPGPGNYNFSDEIGTNAPKFSFGKDERGDCKRPMTPGPGHYIHKSTVGTTGPKFSMLGNRPQSSSSLRDVPGPGQYNINLNNKTKAPSFKIGNEIRSNLNKSAILNPGPGQYSIQDNSSIRPKSPTWKMGSSTRKPLYFTESNPGPGNYNSSNTIGYGPKVIIIELIFSILCLEKIV